MNLLPLVIVLSGPFTGWAQENCASHSRTSDAAVISEKKTVCWCEWKSSLGSHWHPGEDAAVCIDASDCELRRPKGLDLCTVGQEAVWFATTTCPETCDVRHDFLTQTRLVNGPRSCTVRFRKSCVPKVKR